MGIYMRDAYPREGPHPTPLNSAMAASSFLTGLLRLSDVTQMAAVTLQYGHPIFATATCQRPHNRAFHTAYGVALTIPPPPSVWGRTEGAASSLWRVCAWAGGVDEYVDWSLTAPKRSQERPPDKEGDSVFVVRPRS